MGYLDYNLFNAIAQDSGYAQKSAMKQREMQYVGELEQRAEKRSQEQMLQNEAANAYMEKIGEQIKGALPQDVDRLRAVEASAKENVMAGIREAGGDMKNFFLTGGATTLRQYRKDIVNSDAAVQATQNLSVHNRIQEALGDGKLLHNVTVDLKKGGKDVTKQVSAQEMKKLFSEGKINKLTWGGAEDKVKVTPAMFLKQGSPRARYTPGTMVSVEEYAATAMSLGQSSDIAWQEARRMDRGDGNTSLMWGVDDFDYANIHKYATANNKGKKTHADIANVMKPWLEGDSLVTSDFSHATWTRQNGERHRVNIAEGGGSREMQDALWHTLGINQDAQGNWRGKFNQSGFLNLNDGSAITLNQNEYEFEGMHSGIKYVQEKEGGQVHAYALADVRISEDMAEDKGVEHWFHGSTKGWEGNQASEKRDELGFNDSWRITVAIPLTLDPFAMEMANQKIGHKLGQVIGGIEQEDWAGTTMLAPEGSPERMGASTKAHPMMSIFGGDPSMFGGTPPQSNANNPQGQHRTDMGGNTDLEQWAAQAQIEYPQYSYEQLLQWAITNKADYAK